MTCDAARERIVLECHGELDAGPAAELAGHLRGCPSCAAAAAGERRLLALMALDAAPAMDETFLEACRARLRAALAPAPSAPWWARLRPSPALAAGLFLAAGFLLGRLVPAPGAAPVGVGPRDPGAETVATVSDLRSDPESRRVSLQYEIQRQASLEGAPGDPEIRRLLVDTARGSLNSGLRLEALEALRDLSDHDDVRAALLDIVRHDENPGARLKAIEALEASAGRDAGVRDALLQTLLRDANPGVRVRAVDALEDAGGPEILPVFERLAREDPNDYVRLRSAAYVTHASDHGGPR